MKLKEDIAIILQQSPEIYRNADEITDLSTRDIDSLMEKDLCIADNEYVIE